MEEEKKRSAKEGEQYSEFVDNSDVREMPGMKAEKKVIRTMKKKTRAKVIKFICEISLLPRRGAGNREEVPVSERSHFLMHSKVQHDPHTLPSD